MKWASAKNSLVAARNSVAVEQRYSEIERMSLAPARSSESVDEYLARGGKIIRIGGTRAMTTPKKEIEVKKMKAREAAQLANSNPDLTADEIRAMIPEYKAPLPRRSWVAAFKAAITDPARFAEL